MVLVQSLAQEARILGSPRLRYIGSPVTGSIVADLHDEISEGLPMDRSQGLIQVVLSVEDWHSNGHKSHA